MSIAATNKTTQSIPAAKDAARIVIAGGGTGGHIFPAIAIANALKQSQPNIEILFIGAKGKMEMEKVPQAGFNIIGISIAGFNRNALWKNVGLPFKIITSFFQVANIFSSFKPTAVIGVGGYSSFPVLRFAQSKNIPTYIHESNAFAGKANILLGKKATAIFVATDGMERFFPANKIVKTGNPVRKSIAESTLTKQEGAAFFHLDPKKRTVLIVGGSLGAKSINDTIANNISTFQTQDIQLIWQTGKGNEHYVALSSNYNGVWVGAFIQQMEYAYAAADIVVSRSGAMAVAELCLLKKPTVFVPYPFAAEDHQTANAQQLVDNHAALMVADKNVVFDLITLITSLGNDTSIQEKLSKNIERFAIKNADTVIAQYILNIVPNPLTQ